MKLHVCWVALGCAALALGVGQVGAQGSSRVDTMAAGTTTPVVLTIDQAVAIAQKNNPDFQSTRNGTRNAAVELRSAYGALLPQVSASMSGQYQQGGRQFLSGVALGANSDILQSQYNLGLSYSLNAGNLLAPKVQRANSAAVDADVAGAQESLTATIKQDYLTALQSLALEGLGDSLVANAKVQLTLSQAKAQVGTGTLLDVQRAEVALGQQQVALLQAHNQHAIDMLRLFQQMGVSASPDVRLTDTTKPVTASGGEAAGDGLPTLEALLTMARERNPGVAALRSRATMANLTVKKARLAYTPTLTISTGIGGYTYQYRDPNYLIDQAQASAAAAQSSCVSTQEVRQAVGLPNMLSQCANLVFTPAMAGALKAQNSQFPFDFTSSPKSVSAQLTLPLFDGFAREQRVQEAAVARDNARNTVRSGELALEADVRAAYLSLGTAGQTVVLQEANSAKAKQELQFVQDQYVVGLATFVDLTTSRAAYAQAENDHINAVYNYQKAVAALESAVGHPLR